MEETFRQNMSLSRPFISAEALAGDSTLSPDILTEDQEISADTSMRILDIVVYSLFFIIGAPANVRVLMILVRNQLYTKSRHHTLLLNLAFADTIVCLIMIPTEVGWRLTSDWRAGDIGCRVFQFFRVFGLYASSMVLICISIDRYYAVVHPFSYALIGDTINKLLMAAWASSILLSLPQMAIFHVDEHPTEKGFFQCVAMGSFPEPWMEKLYTLMCNLFLYGLPLLVIITCYTIVTIRSIYHQKKAAALRNKIQLNNVTPSAVTMSAVTATTHHNITVNIPSGPSVGRGDSPDLGMESSKSPSPSPSDKIDEVSPAINTGNEKNGNSILKNLTKITNDLRKASSVATLTNAQSTNNPTAATTRSKNQKEQRSKILRQTLVIIITFLVCWTPYIFISTWYQIDEHSASELNESVKAILFLFAVSNSIINPFLYGKFVNDNPQRV